MVTVHSHGDGAAVPADETEGERKNGGAVEEKECRSPPPPSSQHWSTCDVTSCWLMSFPVCLSAG